MKIKEIIFKIYNKILDTIYPKDISCIFCERDITNPTDTYSCKECIKNLPYNDNYCFVCGAPLLKNNQKCINCMFTRHNFHRARSVFSYEYPVDQAIKNFKFKGYRYYSKPFASYMSVVYLKNNFNSDYIIPVPLTKTKQKLRGFNQSLELANELGKFINVEVLDDRLEKIKETPEQVSLGFSGRRKNLTNAFVVRKASKIKGKSILLIDDVFTTGSTVEECSKMLIQAGVREVNVLTIAHARMLPKIKFIGPNVVSARKIKKVK